jgi:acyl carrier protein
MGQLEQLEIESEEQTFTCVAEIVASHFGRSTDTIERDTTFVKDLGADSLDRPEVDMEIEDFYDFESPDGEVVNLDEEADHCETVGALVTCVRTLLQEILDAKQKKLAAKITKIPA